MDEHIDAFFSQHFNGFYQGNFHRVIPLHNAPDMDWKTISAIAPALPRGWYELCQLSVSDKIEFTLSYWLTKLPFHPKWSHFISQFFGSLDDIAVFLTQKKMESPFEAQMVYSLAENRGFFRGGAPCGEKEITDLQKLFPDYILPNDYLTFLQIHDGFCKTTDCTGIISTKQMPQKFQEFQKMVENLGQLTTRSGKWVDPKSLIPFYESFGMPYYQCFWAYWHPIEGMGNVYYSSSAHTISEADEADPLCPERLAFPTFIDWLMFYLERVEG